FGPLGWFASRAPKIAAGAIAAAAIAAVVFGLASGRLLDDESSVRAPVTEATEAPAEASTQPVIVPLADLNVPRGRLLYWSAYYWCSSGTDGADEAALADLPAGALAVTPSPGRDLVAFLERPEGNEHWLDIARADSSGPRRLAKLRTLHDPVPPVWSPD